jgi:hypothetical protein
VDSSDLGDAAEQFLDKHLGQKAGRAGNQKMLAAKAVGDALRLGLIHGRRKMARAE